MEALKLVLFDSVSYKHNTVIIIGFNFIFIPQHTKLYAIQGKMPLDDEGIPHKSDALFQTFVDDWYGTVAKAVKENPNAVKSSNVRKPILTRYNLK